MYVQNLFYVNNLYNFIEYKILLVIEIYSPKFFVKIKINIITFTVLYFYTYYKLLF